MARKSGKAQANESVFDLPCSYGNVSIGDKTCNVKASISRSALKLSEADKKLCEHRLIGRIIAKPAGWQSSQEALPGMSGDDIEMEGCFDVKGLNVKSSAIGIGLTFSIKDVDVSTLAKFAKRDGRIVVDSIEELPEGQDDEFADKD
jgi:hypothetical protein